MHTAKAVPTKTTLSPAVTLLLMCLMLISTTQYASAFSLQRLDVQRGSQQLQDLMILDARPLAQFQQGHIAGAHSLSWEDYTRPDSNGVNYRIAPLNELTKALGHMGISETSAVLIYGDADTSWGGEGWAAWLLAWLGHQGPVYILDGGIQAWQAAQLPLVTTVTPATEVTYQASVQPQLQISAAEIDTKKDHITLVDTRNYWMEWLPGHLPNAIHLDWKELFHGEDNRAIDAQAFKKLLEKKGIDLNKPVVYYCTGGIRSGYAWMVHELAGLPSAINFEGGTEEWAAFKKQP